MKNMYALLMCMTVWGAALYAQTGAASAAGFETAAQGTAQYTITLIGIVGADGTAITRNDGTLRGQRALFVLPTLNLPI